MEQNNKISEREDLNESGFLRLPFSEEQFKEFVTSLLGTPQTINKRIRGNFELRLQDLISFHNLIKQRIDQQNNAKLLQVQTQIYFDDESSVILSSLPELVSYNEVKPIASEAAKITWTYLVKFEDKKIPEKQTIELMIVSSPFSNVVEDEISPIYHWHESGQFTITVKHTARSWGSDIESLLTNQINSLIQTESWWRKFLRKRRHTVGNLSGVFFMFFATLGISIANKEFLAAQILASNEFLSAQNSNDQKIDYLINFVSSNTHNLFFFNSIVYFTVSLLVAITVAVLVSTLANLPIRSHLLLTKKSEEKYATVKKKSQRKILLFIITMIFNFLLSLASSFLFVYLIA